MLSKALQNIGCITQMMTTSITVLVGDDTDLLVLLCYHASEQGYDLYFRPEPKANARGSRVWHMKKFKE